MKESSEEKKPDYSLKVIMVGSCGVGKTQLVSKYTRNEFTEENNMTIGVDFTPMKVEINEKNISINIWDTSGEDKYQSITSVYYRGATGVILVYDITSKESFEDLSTKWMKQIRSNIDPKSPIMLVGNKSDLKDERQVSKEDALDFARVEGNS